MVSPFFISNSISLLYWLLAWLETSGLLPFCKYHVQSLQFTFALNFRMFGALSFLQAEKKMKSKTGRAYIVVLMIDRQHDRQNSCLVVQFEHSHKRTLWNFNISNLLHAFFTGFLFFQKFTLP